MSGPAETDPPGADPDRSATPPEVTPDVLAEMTPPVVAETRDETPDETELPPAALRLAEALLFAAARPVSEADLATLLPDHPPHQVLAALRARFAGGGVELVEVAGGWQFRTAPDLAQALTRVIARPRRLPRAAMETLAIIAYHQPLTRPEIEEIRGVALAQTTLESLLQAGLIAAHGRKEVPGRPSLWVTTGGFLEQFGLRDLRDLPRREDLLTEAPMHAAAITAPETAAEADPEADTEADPEAGEGAAIPLHAEAPDDIPPPKDSC